LRRAHKEPPIEVNDSNLLVAEFVSGQFCRKSKSTSRPEKKKSALVRKEIQLLQKIVGQDPDQDQLLEVGKNIAKRRIVVKRPNSAEYLNNQKPNTSIKSKNYRFDIYLIEKRW